MSEKRRILAKLEQTLSEMNSVHWRHTAPIRDEIAELRKQIAEEEGSALEFLPAPRWRTDKQRRVAACPRCGERPE